jgi:hypothetical protein
MSFHGSAQFAMKRSMWLLQLNRQDRVRVRIATRINVFGAPLDMGLTRTLTAFL